MDPLHGFTGAIKPLCEGDTISAGNIAFYKIEDDRECTVEVELTPCPPESGECYTIIPIIQYTSDNPSQAQQRKPFEKYFLTVYTRKNDSEFTFIPDEKSLTNTEGRSIVQ